MRSSAKVFIYNGPGSAPQSISDLQELFSSENIFPCKPDVSITPFDFNPTGLNFPTFVVPGGSTSTMGRSLKPSMDKIKLELKEQFNYLGICAGAFIATIDADLFFTMHEYDNNSNYGRLSPPIFFTTTRKEKANLDFISDFKACGAFYPNDTYLYQKDGSKDYMPYSVNISFSQTQSQQILPQLYVAGPGFFSLPNVNRRSEVIATYHDKSRYIFSYSKHENKCITNFPSIIRKKPQDQEGGVLLSGPHLEACVTNSKMLSFFKSSSPENPALKEEEYENLLENQAQTKTLVENLLRETFSM
jgi:glutamine amidotransferase-like uncharacterized protein